jgi:hypothetical protein
VIDQNVPQATVVLFMYLSVSSVSYALLPPEALSSGDLMLSLNIRTIRLVGNGVLFPQVCTRRIAVTVCVLQVALVIVFCINVVNQEVEETVGVASG